MTNAILREELDAKNSLRCGVMNLLLTMAVIGFCGVVCGEPRTCYLAGVDAPGESALVNAARWGVGTPTGPASGAEGESLDPNSDYVVSDGYTLRTPGTSLDFPGNSLSIDASYALFALCPAGNGCVYTFRDLVVKQGATVGNLKRNNPTVAGKVTFFGDSTRPVNLYDNGNGSSIAFTAAVHGDASSEVLIYNSVNVREENTWSQEHCRIIFREDALADFNGTIRCRQYASPVGKKPDPSYRASLVTGGVTNNCSVVLEYRGGLGADEAKEISIKSLSLADGAFLSVNYDASVKATSCFVVRESLTMEGKTTVEFDPGTITMGTYPDSAVVPECPILTAPAGVELDSESFSLSVDVVFPVYELLVHDNAAGLSTLYVRQCGKVVKSTAGDASADGWTKCKQNGGDHWSDGLPPGDTNLYYATHGFRAYAVNGVYDTAATFPGRALAMASPAQLYLFPKNYTVADLRTLSEAFIYSYTGAGPVHLHGEILCQSPLNLMGNDGRTLDIHSTIRGGSSVYVLFANNSAGNYVNIHGTNENFTGSFNFSALKNSGNAPDKYVTVKFENSHAFGGDIPAWKYNSHSLGAWTHLKPLESMTISCKNRGFLVSGEGVIETDPGIVFGLTERISWNGTLRKIGTGVFALGGEEACGSTGTGSSPVEGKNQLLIDAGKLKPLSAAAFDGVAVTLSEGASLTLDVPEKNDANGLATYGMKLVKEGSALTLPAGGVTVEITDPTGASRPLSTLSRRVPICTVAASAAPMLRGNFNLGESPYPNYSLALREIDNHDDTVTFAVDMTTGILIMVR